MTSVGKSTDLSSVPRTHKQMLGVEHTVMVTAQGRKRQGAGRGESEGDLWGLLAKVVGSRPVSYLVLKEMDRHSEDDS